MPGQPSGFSRSLVELRRAQPVEALQSCAIPFSDNTLLRSGNRFGIFLTRFDMVPDVLRVMRLWFVWFPRNFAPPRERPFDLDVGTSPPLAGQQ